MKALLIADSSLAIENISQVLETAGYDVIVYKWLIKALDNIEEIGPHLIVVSTTDYPRHWKTLTQFASTDFGGYKPAVVLYAEGGLNEDDTRKAQTLKVRGIFESVDVQGLDQLREILVKEIDIYSGRLMDEDGHKVKIEAPAVEETGTVAEESFAAETETVAEDTGFVAEETEIASDDTEIVAEDNEAAANEVKYCTFMFTNPVSGVLVTGYASNFDGHSFEFQADIDDFTKNLYTGVQIPSGAIKIDDTCSAVTATVKSNEEVLVLELD